MRLLLAPLCAAAVVLGGCGTPDRAPQAYPEQLPTASEPETAVGSAAAVIRENAQPGDPSWRQAKAHARPGELSAYADRSSAFPGDPVGLFVSTTAATFTVRAYRLGHYGGAQGRVVWESDPQTGRVQSESGYDEATRMPYARWRQSLKVDTSDWVPGVYVLRLQTDTGAQWLVPLVLRDRDVADRLMLVIPDTTSQAYNAWGGRSAYSGPGGFADRSRAVSFSRPYVEGAGVGRYFSFAHPVVVLAERAGLPVTYAAASDLDNDPDALQGAQGVVFLGHDEYWTQRRRRGAQQARDAGTNLGFLGANTMYWRTRLQPGPNGLAVMTVYKDPAEDPVRGRNATVRFRDSPAAHPERSLIGMDYECYPAKGTFVVADPDFFLFQGTGATTGQRYEGIVDIEVDRAYPLPGTPGNLQVVAANPTDCDGSPTTSTATYYSTESGAGVFATGTMGWISRGLRSFAVGDPRRVPDDSRAFTRRVTLNLLRAMSAGPMGTAHPAEGNIEEFDLPEWNTTGKA